MARVILVNPTRTGSDSFVLPPLHLLYLKKALKAVSGCVCDIVDVSYDFYRKTGLEKNVPSAEAADTRARIENDNIEKIARSGHDVLGIGGVCTSFNFTERLIRRVREVDPGRLILVGGGLGLPLRDLWFEREIDFIVEAAAEISLKEIVEAFPDREKIKNVKGVYHRSDGKWKGSPPSLPMDLDHIAYPDWEDIDYRYFMEVHAKWVRHTLPANYDPGLVGGRILPVVFTRGCPYNCTFCYHNDRSHRKHSVGYIIGYLRHLREKFGVNYIQTWDDLIITDRKWFIELCGALAKEKPGLKIFMSGGKPNLIDEEMLDKMKQAGVIRISYGIESGSRVILKEMRKGATKEENFRAVTMTSRKGIYTHLNMVLGMPSETKETLKETGEWLKKTQLEAGLTARNMGFSFASAYPGTDLYRIAVDKGFIKDHAEYIRGDRGVGDYHLNLCGLGEKYLKKYVEWTLLAMEMRELKRRPEARRLMSIVLVRVPKFIIKYFLPRWVADSARRLFRGVS